MTEPIKRNYAPYQNKLLDIVNGDMFEISRLMEEQKALNNAVYTMLDNLIDFVKDGREREITINIISLIHLQEERINHLSDNLYKVTDKISDIAYADNKSEKEQGKQ